MNPFQTLSSRCSKVTEYDTAFAANERPIDTEKIIKTNICALFYQICLFTVLVVRGES